MNWTSRATRSLRRNLGLSLCCRTQLTERMYFPHLSESFRQSLEALRGKPTVVLGHMRPDGDCIGSQVALCRALIQSGVPAVCLNADPVPRTLKAFVGDTPFFSPAALEYKNQVAIAVDCADATRMGSRVRDLFPDTFLNVDHHISNTKYAERNIVQDDAAATAEILAGLLLDLNLPIDPVTAQALYLGIATDTGQFRFPATSPRVFELCSRLIALGASPSAAASEIYERETMGRVALLQRFLASLKLECGGKVCIGTVPSSVYEDTGASREDTEGLVDYARCIDGVVIGVLVEERPTGVKGSLRAKDPAVRVDKLAQLFGGGGHACAAGFNTQESMNAFYPRLLASLQAHLRALDGSASTSAPACGVK